MRLSKRLFACLREKNSNYQKKEELIWIYAKKVVTLQANCYDCIFIINHRYHEEVFTLYLRFLR